MSSWGTLGPAALGLLVGGVCAGAAWTLTKDEPPPPVRSSSATSWPGNLCSALHPAPAWRLREVSHDTHVERGGAQASCVMVGRGLRGRTVLQVSVRSFPKGLESARQEAITKTCDRIDVLGSNSDFDEEPGQNCTLVVNDADEEPLGHEVMVNRTRGDSMLVASMTTTDPRWAERLSVTLTEINLDLMRARPDRRD